MIDFVKNFWCQKVLPLVYTDALSYYEMLGKFVGKLNEVIGNVNNLNENTVFSVNNVKPVNGNVTIDNSNIEGIVSGVNGKKPDGGGEVTLTAEDVGAVPDTTVVVSSVNGIAPTGGNVNVGTVKTVNGSAPDANGNINLPQVSGVTSVDGIVADASGNVPLNAVKSVNNITPTDGNVNVGTVKSVNSKTPDNAGNVDVGTVKSINNTITPDAAGNITMTSDSINAVAKENGSVTTNLIADKAVTRNKVSDEIIYTPEESINTTNSAYIIKNYGGKLMWVYGDGNLLELDKAEFDRLETFWEVALYNSQSVNLTLKFTGLPSVVNTLTGESLGGTAQVSITKFKAVKLKKISNSALLILPA